MAEDLTDYLLESGVRARYLHSEIDTLDRIQLIRELRLGEYDVLVGVNLREGLDLPEVSLIAILDADKEGFLRGKTALIERSGAPREHKRQGGHVRGQADRGDQGRARGDRPSPRGPARLQRGARDHAGVDHQGRLRHRRVPGPRVADGAEAGGEGSEGRRDAAGRAQADRDLEEEMFAAADDLRFEYAAKLRDEIKLRRRELQAAEAAA